MPSDTDQSEAGWRMVNEFASWLKWMVCIWGLWFIGREIWYSRARYSMQYQAPYGNVTKRNEPHDCDFMKAPIGNKECHFEIQVQKDLVTYDASSRKIVSYDNGVTWTTDTGAGIYETASSPVTPGSWKTVAVSLTWNKVEDE